MKFLFVFTILVFLPACTPVNPPAPPPGMPLDQEHLPSATDQALTRNLIGSGTPAPALPQ